MTTIQKVTAAQIGLWEYLYVIVKPYKQQNQQQNQLQNTWSRIAGVIALL